MEYAHLYNEQDKKILKDAEDALDPKIDRIQEIIKYAKHTGLKTIGIANCTTFNKEADKLEEILTGEGFVVAKVNCKLGGIPFKEIVPGYPGVTCNPAGQAKFLEENNTELNIMIGLCLGHDMIFNAKSKAPVTPLAVKDRKEHHNTISVLSRDKNS